MGRIGTEKQNQALISALYCLAQMLYWSSGFATVGYAAAYLGSIGFSNRAIGLITALAGLTGFALVLALSVWIDRAGDGALTLGIGGVLVSQLLLIICLAAYRYAGFLPALLYTLFLSLGHVMNSLFSKLYIDLKTRGMGIDFGLARGLGSLAFAGSSFSIGYLLAQRPGLYVHWLTLVFYVLLLLVTLSLRLLCRRLPGKPESVSAAKRKETPLRIGPFLRDYRLFLVLVLGISLVSAANKTFTTFLVNLVVELGGDIGAFTRITGFLALIEIPVMLFFSRLRKRHSISAMLLMSLLLYAVKLGGAAAARSLPVLFAAVTAQTFAAGLYHPASVEFIRETIPHRDTAKCQALLDGAPVFVSFLTITGFGTLLDSLPARTVCLLLFLLALLGTFLSQAVIRHTRPAPLSRDRF